MSDLVQLFMEEERVRRWGAERENASARLELAQMRRNIAHLLSQHEPVASLGLDRDMLRIALNFVSHGDVLRANREMESK